MAVDKNKRDNNRLAAILFAFDYLTRDKEKKNNLFSLQQCLSAIIAEMIFRCDWKGIESLSTVCKIAYFINYNIDKKDFKKFQQYSCESLYLLVAEKYDFTDRKDLLPQLDWAYEITPENQISLDKYRIKKEQEQAKQKSYPPYAISQYGDEVHEKENNAKVVDSKKVESKKEQDEEVNNIQNKINTLYNYIVNARGGKKAIKQFEYIWQWKISKSEYKNIKELLCCDACKRNIKSISRNNACCRLLVVIYIAERYKREWNGSDGKDNALEQIGLNNEETKEIATNYFKKQDKIYSSESGYTEWLDSLRIEGGLPIYYVSGYYVSGNNNISKFCEKLYQSEDDAINILNNNTIKYSYEKGYSIFKYIDTIKKTDSFKDVFSEEDLKDELFINFIKLLTEGRIKSRKETNKFKYKYRVWTFQNEFLLHRSIEFKQDSNYGESKELISIDRIKEQWGVDDITPNDIFWLEVAEKRYEFHPWGDGFFRSDIGLTEFLLPTEKKDNCSLSNDSISYVDKKGNRKEIKSIVGNSKDYIKFSSNDGYDWDDGTRGKYHAILLLKKIDVESEYCDVDKPLNGNYRWIEFFDKIKVGDECIYSTNQEIYPTENEKVLHPIVKSSYVRKVYHCVGDVQNDIYVLDASNLVGENFVRKDKDGNQGKCNKVKYKTREMSSFKDYQIGEIVQGFMRLDVDGIPFNAYVLTEDAKISRKECSENRGYVVVSNIDKCSVEGCSYKNNGWVDEYDDDNSMRDSVEVKVTLSDEEYLVFDVIRPLNRSDKMLNGRVLASNQDIPLKLKSQYKLRVINEKGVKYSKDVRCSRPYSNKRIENHNQGFYFIDNGKDIQIEKNLEFVFISSNGEETKLNLSEQSLQERGQSIRYLYFNNLPEGDGVIIQSLQNVMPELTYYEPCYINSKEKAIGNQSALDRLKLSLKHKLYFVELLYLSDKHDETIIQGNNKQESKYKNIRDYNTYENEITPKLLIDYFSYYSENYSDNYDWSFLWDIADRLKVDWMMGIHQSCWKNFVGNDDKKKQLVIELFKNSTKKDENNKHISWQYREFIDNYWSLKWIPKIGSGNRTDEYRFLQEMLQSNNEPHDKKFITIPNIDKEKMHKEIDELKQRLNTK